MTLPAFTNSKLTIETSEKCDHWRRSDVFIVNFEHISHLVSIVNFKHVIAGWGTPFST